MNAKKILALLLGGAPLLLASSDALAWVPLDPGYPRWNVGGGVQYKVRQSSIPPSIAAIGVARIDAGFASWGAPACTAFAAINTGDTALSYNYQDGVNVLRWISSNWPAQLGDVNSVIGVTMPVWDNSYEIFDADIVFNDVGFNWNDTGANGNVDTQSIATHEQGHFLGLDHTSAGGATMQAFYPGGTGMRTLEQDDEDGVCGLYPIGGTAASGGGSDCQTCVNDVNDPGGQCEAETDACIANQACIDLYECIGPCQDQPCVDQCAQMYQSGIDDINDMFNCWCTFCGNECNCAPDPGTTSATTGGNTTGGNTTVGVTTGGQTSGVTTSANAVGVGGAGSGVGVTGAGGDDPPNPKASTEPESFGGCGCNTGGSSAGVGTLLLLSALGAAVSRRRRRR